MQNSAWGIDGCGIPTYAMSLQGMARAMAHLLTDLAMSSDRKAAFTLIREAVTAEPFYISGTGEFCTDMIKETKGRVIVKTGAEGVYAGVMTEQGLAFALKARDGGSRASRVATAAILRAFQGLSEQEFLRLSHHTEPLVKNWAGVSVGKIFVPHSLIE
jgi:L-asparaginase II